MPAEEQAGSSGSSAAGSGGGIDRSGPREVHPTVTWLAAYCWRLLAIGAVGFAALWLLGQLKLVVLPVVLAVFLTRILSGPAAWLRGHGWPALLATWTVLIGFLAALTLAGVLIVPTVVDEFDSLGPTLQEANDDIDEWLIEDSPFDLTRQEVEDAREGIAERARQALNRSDGTVVRGAVLVAEVFAGLLLAFVLSVFMVKDGPRFQRWATGVVPARRREEVRVMAAAAWAALGGYLRSAAILGIVEAVIIGLAVQLAGGELVVPVMVLTFFAAFVPLVGAVVAGAIAVLVTLATGGIGGALIVLAVAVAVQQLDNDILAPFIYGHSLQLHPVVVLLAIAGGSALFGIAGTFLAVPVTAVVINSVKARRDLLAGDGQPSKSSSPSDARSPSASR
jgi:predicted PurR-regulated permease PerM